MATLRLFFGFSASTLKQANEGSRYFLFDGRNYEFLPSSAFIEECYLTISLEAEELPEFSTMVRNEVGLKLREQDPVEISYLSFREEFCSRTKRTCGRYINEELVIFLELVGEDKYQVRMSGTADVETVVKTYHEIRRGTHANMIQLQENWDESENPVPQETRK